MITDCRDPTSDSVGEQRTLAQVWDYVNGCAARLEGCTPGIRDANNDGKAARGGLEAWERCVFERRESAGERGEKK